MQSKNIALINILKENKIVHLQNINRTLTEQSIKHSFMKKTLWCGLVLATVLSSCMKDKNLYDEDRVSSKKQEEYNKNFPVKDLDPNQDWSTFEAIKANVTVNEDAL